VIPSGRARRQARAAIGFVALALLAASAAAGCARGDAAPRGKVVEVHERDFVMTAKVTAVRTGLVTFRVGNSGPSTHEFLVDRTSENADALPLRANDITVNEQSKLLHPVGSLGEIRLGATRELTLRLDPGHYVLFCNLEGHYRGGMFVSFEVIR
jgi:uncharacterized cupredoxin-like copper-binding protein